MKAPFSTLSTREYPGRVIMFGRDVSGEHNVIGYAITGRSPSSQARVLEFDEENSLVTGVTDPDLLMRGNPDLLLYACAFHFNQSIIISNSAQTDLLFDAVESNYEGNTRAKPLDILVEALSQPTWIEGHEDGQFLDLTTFEPDAPNFTPRIGGIISDDEAAMVICKEDHGKTARSFYSFPLHPGKARLISTYEGTNAASGEAIQPFGGEPFEEELKGDTPEEIAGQLYHALGPKKPGSGIVSPGKDFRVSVAVMFLGIHSRRVTSHIINRYELENES